MCSRGARVSVDPSFAIRVEGDMTSECNAPPLSLRHIPYIHIHQQKKALMALLIGVLHMGHVSTAEAQFTQATRCWQGKNSTLFSSSKHTAHGFCTDELVCFLLTAGKETLGRKKD